MLNLKQKLHFHQDENLRLSHELSNSQKKYKLIKEQLNEIENEKSQISQKIEDLTNSLSKTKIISNIFNNKDEARYKKYVLEKQKHSQYLDNLKLETQPQESFLTSLDSYIKTITIP